MKQQLPPGWLTVKIKDVCAKGQYGWTTKACNDGTIKFLRTTDITKGKINWELVPFCEQPPTDCEKYLIEPGDVLISRAGSVGFSTLIDTVKQPTVFASYLIRFKVGKTLNPSYFSKFLLSPYYWSQISQASAGIALANVNAQKLGEVELALAPISEQKRIADKLEVLLGRVDACKERLELVPALLKRFRQSVLATATTGKLTADWRVKYGADDWKQHKIEDLVTIKNGRAFPSIDYCTRGIRLLRPGNLHVSGKVDWQNHNTIYLPLQYKEDFPNYALQKGELLMNLTAQSLKDEFLGRVCIKKDSEPALLNQRICAFYPKTKWDIRKYLLYYFKAPHFRAFVDTLDSGSLIKHMNSKHLLAHQLLVPPEIEQVEIIRRVEMTLDSIDKIEALIERTKTRGDKLKTSILAKAFRGELVAQDRNDEPVSIATRQSEITSHSRDTLNFSKK